MTHADILNSLLYNSGKVLVGKDPDYSIMSLTSERGSTAWFLAKTIWNRGEETVEYEILSYKIDNRDNALESMLIEAIKFGIAF